MDLTAALGAAGLMAVMAVGYGLVIRGSRTGAGCSSCGDLRTRAAAMRRPLGARESTSPGSEQGQEREPAGGTMEIRIFGPGCWRCHTLEERTREALATLGREATITMVQDVFEMAAAGTLRTPAMQIDGHFVLQGRVPGVRELESILSKASTEPDGAH